MWVIRLKCKSSVRSTATKILIYLVYNANIFGILRSFVTQELTMYLCKTYFSFKYGTFSTEEVVKAGVEAGLSSMALTNINSTCDAWDFVQFCREQGIRPV